MLKPLDILLLLKLVCINNPNVHSKQLADELSLSPSEVTQSLKRCKASGLLYLSDLGKRVNRAGLLELLIHGFRFIFPAQKGSLTRGMPTGIAAPPLKAMFDNEKEPPPVWPYEKGNARGFALAPLHKQVPKAASFDTQLYELLALVDAIRGDRVRERQLAAKELTKRLEAHE